ncbi:hypothetical protein K8Z49_17375 [Actinomadura madurae]|uniref:hypothetical protein n=1 Tax=Actinomadura madurae TaxID=1993 RepID=UPI00399BE35D
MEVEDSAWSPPRLSARPPRDRPRPEALEGMAARFGEVEVVGSGPAGLLLYGGERWNGHEAAARGLVDKCTENAPAAVERILTSLRDANDSAITSTTTSIRTTPRFQR